VALPIVAPPALVIIFALALFFVFESVCWVPLQLSAWVKRRRESRPVKQVNRPAF